MKLRRRYSKFNPSENRHEGEIEGYGARRGIVKYIYFNVGILIMIGFSPMSDVFTSNLQHQNCTTLHCAAACVA